MTAADVRRVFRAPALLAVLTLIGLVSALVGDGAWDALSWCALALPVAVIGWQTARPKTS